MSKINVSKLDAARRQLTTAIRMFISNGDPVSIHTLASASQEILETLAKKRGIKSQRLASLDLVKKQYKNEVERKLNGPKNFFKHGHRDASETLSFNPKASDFVMWDAAQLYASMTLESIPLFTVYILWIRAEYPQIFILTAEHKKMQQNLFEGLSSRRRTEFFQELLPIAEDALKSQSNNI